MLEQCILFQGLPMLRVITLEVGYMGQLRCCMEGSSEAFTNHFRSEEQTLGSLWPPFRNGFAWIYCFLGLPSVGMGWKAILKVN